MLVFLVVPRLALAQEPPENGNLTIDGHPGKAPLIQIDGKSYVEVEALARLTNGSVSFQGDLITLTLPSSAPNKATPQTEQPGQPGFSKEFLRAAIEEMGVIMEWRIAVVNAVQHYYPLTDDWIGGYRRASDSKLALLSAAVATNSDRNGFGLISNEFGNMQQLSDKYLAIRKSMTYVSPDSLENDPLNQQILSCARNLAVLAASGQFHDVPACH